MQAGRSSACCAQQNFPASLTTTSSPGAIAPPSTRRPAPITTVQSVHRARVSRRDTTILWFATFHQFTSGAAWPWAAFMGAHRRRGRTGPPRPPVRPPPKRCRRRTPIRQSRCYEHLFISMHGDELFPLLRRSLRRAPRRRRKPPPFVLPWRRASIAQLCAAGSDGRPCRSPPCLPHARQRRRRGKKPQKLICCRSPARTTRAPNKDRQRLPPGLPLPAAGRGELSAHASGAISCVSCW